MRRPESQPLPHNTPDASRGMATPEAQESKLLQDIAFQPLTRQGTGEVIGYQSSAPGRKVIALAESSIIPAEGQAYTVRVLQDTKPEDPLSGKLVCEIVIPGTEHVAEETWQQVDENLREGEVAYRKSTKASVRLYGETGATKQDRLSLEDDKLTGEASKPRVVQKLLDREAEYGEELEVILGDDDSLERKLVDFRRENLEKALREVAALESERDGLLGEEAAILSAIKGEPGGEEMEALSEIRQELARVDADRQALIESSPEAFYAVHLKDLKEYKRGLQTGRIAETPYVRKHIEDIVSHFRANRPVFIYGHLGSGKTELVMHIARNHILANRPDLDAKVEEDFARWQARNSGASEAEQSQQRREIEKSHKSALVVSGSKSMSLAELYGHQVLAVDKINQEDLDAYTSAVEAKYQQWLTESEEKLKGMPDSEREAEKDRAHDRILQTYLMQFKGSTVSDYFLGPIYKAMQEGRPVIIDEGNAIPHEILISLNHILTRRVGDTVNVQQNSGTQITVREGFGIMMTGNLNQGEQKYVDRQNMDPAFLSRLYKLEYDYLPQKTEGSLDDEAGPDNELFQLLLARVMDKNGNMEVPADTVKKLWSLAKVARITQDVFAGKEINTAFYFQVAGGRPVKYLLKESVLSIRSLEAVVTQWQREAYKHELDYYVWKEFISQSTVPSDRAYLYQLFKDRFGFFSGPGWEQSPDYGSSGSFDIKAPQNKSAVIEFKGPRDVVEYAYGSAPARTQWPTT